MAGENYFLGLFMSPSVDRSDLLFGNHYPNNLYLYTVFFGEVIEGSFFRDYTSLVLAKIGVHAYKLEKDIILCEIKDKLRSSPFTLTNI